MKATLCMILTIVLAAPAAVVWAGPVNSYQAHSIMGAESPPPYGLRLDGFYNGREKCVYTYSFDDVMFEEYEDGTAHLHGQIEINGIGAQAADVTCSNYWLDVWFMRVTAQDDLDRIEDYHPDWRYYMIHPDGLEMWSQDQTADSAHLWSYPADGTKPFRVGYGANGKNDHFGAAGWLSYEHHMGPVMIGDRDAYVPASDFLMDLDIATDVGEERAQRPEHFEVTGNYPNPFNPSTNLAYVLDRPAHVRVDVFNLLGGHVRTLVDARQAAGEHVLRWDGTNAAGQGVSTGTYLYRIRVDGTAETRKMLLLK